MKKAIAGIKGGARPGLLGDDTSSQFAICIDARDPKAVVLRGYASSPEIGRPVSGFRAESPGIATVPVNMLRKLLAAIKCDEFVLESCELAHGEYGSQPAVKFAFRGGCVVVKQHGWKLYPELISPPGPAPEAVPVAPDRSPVDWQTIAGRYRSGEGFASLSRSIGIPATTIHGRLRSIGVEFNHRKAAR